MEARNFYLRQSNLRKNSKRFGAIRAILVFGLMWLTLSVDAQTITYSQSFTGGAAASSAACNAWATFRSQLLGSYVYSGFKISGSLDPVGISCNTPAIAANVANALRTGGTYGGSSDGHIWYVGPCSTNNCGAGTNIELNGDVPSGGCSCSSVGYTVRPSYGVAGWWGGIGNNCAGVSQTLTVTFYIQPVTFDGGSPQSLTVCQNSGATSISSLLKTTDAGGLTETWSVSGAPTHGLIGGLPATGASGTSVFPAGVTYTPAPGYVGTDAFTIQVSNGSNTATTTINVTVNPLPTVTAGSNVAICNGSSTTLSASGAATYSWSPATGLSATTGANVTANPTALTTYTITGTAVGGCVATGNITVSVNPIPAVSGGSNVAICNGSSTTLTATGATTYVWSPSTGLSATTGASVTANPTSLTHYTVTGTSLGCSSNASVTVSVNPLPVIGAGAGVTTCSGTGVTLTATGGTTYSWAPSTGLSAITGASVVATPVGTTIYTVTGTSAGCSNTASVQVSVNPLPSPITGAGTPLCQGATMTLNSATSGGTWSSSNPNATVGSANGIVTGINGGGVTITYTLPTSCYVTTAITVNPSPSSVSAGGGVGICTGTSTTLTATGANTYAWSPSTGLSATTGATITANPGSTTTYTVVGTNSFGCSRNATVTVSVNSMPAAITGTLDLCEAGGTLTLASATAGGTWSSSNTNANVNPTTGVVTGVTAGTATISYTVSGCSTTKVVTVHALPVIGAGPNVTICQGSSTALTATGGVTYSWAPATGLSSTNGATVTASPSVTTTYTVTGVGAPAVSQVLVYTDNFTSGAFSTPAQAAQWDSYISSLPSSTVLGFTLKGSADPVGISCTDPVVAQNVADALRNHTNYVGSSDGHTWAVGHCGGMELSNNGVCNCGIGYTVRPGILNPNWGGMGTATCGGISQSLEVDFVVGVGCTNVSTVTVSVNPLPAIGITAGTGTAICAGSSTTLTATGGTSYSWSPATALSATTGASVDANPSSDITYVVSGTDVNGCVNTASIDVTVNPLPAPISGSLNFCLASTVTLTDASGSGTWSSSNNAVATVDASGVVSGVATGVDSIYYTLPTGCSTFVSGTVNPLSDVAPVLSQTICNGASTTPVAFTGSIPGTIFNWENSNSSIGIGGAGTGDIASFSAIDTSHAPLTAVISVMPVNNGCPGTVETFSITVNPTPDVNPSANQALCEGLSTTAIPFSGSVAGTIFTWTNTDGSIGIPVSGTGDIASFAAVDTSAEPLTAVITVMTSAAGCTGSSNSFTITVYPTPVLISTLAPAAICDNSVFSYVPVSSTTGTTFAWNRDAVAGISTLPNNGFGNPNELLTNTTTAVVDVTYQYALEANGCVDTLNVVVPVKPQPTLTSTHTPAAVCDSAMFHYVSTSATAGVTYSWSRASVPGISNTPGYGADSITEYLVNTTAAPVTVYYIDTLSLGGCQYTEEIEVAVNPKPVLTTPVTLPRICDSTNFFYVPASATTGTTFTWSRAAIAGNPSAHGADTISEYLVNNTTNSLVITYVDTLRANGCMNTQTINVPVMPKLLLNSPLVAAPICDSLIFNYPVSSATPGATFAWVRPFVLGIARTAGSGTGNPNEQLINTTNDNLTVVYNYTINDSGCSNTQDVSVVVHPTPVLSSNLAPTVCSGTPLNYGPTSYTFGTTFSWKRGKIAGIAPATDTGSGYTIGETLVDSLLTPVQTGYDITLTANGCSHHQILFVTVNPAPPVGTIATHPDASQCSNTLFQNFGAATPAPAGQYYTWSAQNAEIYAVGSGHQYALVDFKNAGDAVVTLNSHLNGFSCVSNTSYTVHVGTSVSELPQVVYFNGQFICLQNDQDHYQWGYDDAISLDSTIIEGEINPNYFITSPDLTYRYYWVMTTHNGCMQKTYYNIPTGITNVNTAATAAVKVYPNPASQLINVDIDAAFSGNYVLEVVNMLGQKVQQVTTSDKHSTIDVAALSAGTYMVVCYHEGVKIATVRFVKN